MIHLKNDIDRFFYKKRSNNPSRESNNRVASKWEFQKKISAIKGYSTTSSVRLCGFPNRFWARSNGHSPNLVAHQTQKRAKNP